jgi:hypothetical protein
MKRLAFCMLLLALSARIGVAKGLASAVESTVNQAVSSEVCCLPVLEHTSKGKLGYCYLSQGGFLQARIEDKGLRDSANRYPQSYPTCKDPWCVFSKGPQATRYYRTNEQGVVLQLKDKKFEKDHVGILQDAPAQHVADYGLEWTGKQVPACRVDVDVNAELLGPLCIMKAEGEKNLSFVALAQVNAALGALARGDNSYLLFYKTEGAFPVVLGQMPVKYYKALFESRATVKVGACPNGSDGEDFTKLGFVVK